MGGEGGIEHLGAGGMQLLRLAVVDGGRGHQVEPLGDMGRHFRVLKLDSE
jgi:hypothetical protein